MKDLKSVFWYEYKQIYELLKGKLQYGAIIGQAILKDCIKMDEEFIKQQCYRELVVGDWQIGRYAWKISGTVMFQKPIEAKGQQGLWNAEIGRWVLATEEEKYKYAFKQRDTKPKYYDLKNGEQYDDVFIYLPYEEAIVRGGFV